VRAGARAGVAVGAAVTAAAGAMALGLASIDDAGGYAGLSPRFLPSLVVAGLAALGVAIVVSALRGRFVAGPDDASGDAPPSPTARRDLAWVLGGLLLHLASIGTIGFVAAGTLLWTCVARGWGSRRPLRDAAVALAVTLPTWAVFALGLGVSLPLVPLLAR